MATNKLNDRKVRTASKGRYGDGGGLWLTVTTTGHRKWTFRFTFDGKRREMGLGSYPTVSLAAARESALECKRKVFQGIDPINDRRSHVTTIPTFESCAASYIFAHRHEWKNRKHAKQWVRTLRTYAQPVIGKLPVDHIDTENILRALSPIWKEKTETAKRVQGRIEKVLDYATVKGYRDSTNPARWRGHLDTLLARPTKVKKTENHPAMPYENIPEFMDELRATEGISALALRFLILTATRTNETLKAKWDEFDFDKQVWCIPSSRMKAGKEHTVPLTDEVIDILNSVPRFVGNPYVFAGNALGKPISNMAMLQLMRRLGYGINGSRGHYVPHGFRSTFRDWAGETTSFPSDVCEMALAHTIKNKAEAAYRRGSLLAKRVELMQAWNHFVNPTRNNNIVSLTI